MTIDRILMSCFTESILLKAVVQYRRFTGHVPPVKHMRFPATNQLALPCRFERLVPGKLHADGRRYLPLILLRLPEPPAGAPAVPLLGVVDRHHVVDLALEGRDGVARLVFLLSNVRLQEPPRQGLEAEADLAEGRAS